MPDRRCGFVEHIPLKESRAQDRLTASLAIRSFFGCDGGLNGVR
jgi:hypothetical protein